ncbi:MAG TPA: M12 family metallopeptidase [Chitinophagaceae bacterium]
MSHPIKLFCALVLFLISFSAAGQMQVCVDPLPSEQHTTTDGQFGVYYHEYKWTNGSSISIKFFGGTEYVRNQIMNVVRTWEQYANLSFNFVSSGPADIRIAFNEQQGAWSKIGTMALQVPQSQPTMNFGWFNNSTPAMEIQRTALHEFGHAIGLLHEHQNPVSPIKWNYQKAYAYYMQVLGWNKATVDNNIFDRYSITQSNNDFDAQSIMIYPIPAELTMDGFSVGWNTSLSQKDKALIAQLYPKNTRYEPVTTATTTTAAQAVFSNIRIEYNAFRDNKKGMIIRTHLSVLNAVNKKNKLIAYIFWNNDEHMSGSPGSSYTTDKGQLAAWMELRPAYQKTVYDQLELFFPYEALNIEQGEFKLKLSLHLLDESGKQLTASGKYFFTYQNGPVCTNFQTLSVRVNADNNERRIYFAPQFVLKYAKQKASRIKIYFFHPDGTPVKAQTGSGYQTEFGTVYTWARIDPGYEETFYNYNPQQPFSIYLPYDELSLQPGVNNFKFKIYISDEEGLSYAGCDSEMMSFSLTKY